MLDQLSSVDRDSLDNDLREAVALLACAESIRKEFENRKFEAPPFLLLAIRNFGVRSDIAQPAHAAHLPEDLKRLNCGLMTVAKHQCVAGR
jgi:hypothetical protein